MATRRQIAAEWARRDLIQFTLATKADYEVTWFHQKIADALAQVEAGNIHRLMIFMPPQHGKSELATIRFPAWCLGRDPSRHIISTSYSDTYALTFGGRTRDLVRSTLTRSIFPGLELSRSSQSKQHWTTSAGGQYLSAGIGGPITGQGAWLLLIDDPIKNHEEANSPTIRDNKWNWYTSTARTRVRPGGAIVIINTRWHYDDISGRALKLQEEAKAANEPPWTILSFPAIQNQAPSIADPREEGQPLWTRYALEYPGIRETLGPENWSALYQQEPSEGKGSIYQRGWWQTYSLGNGSRPHWPIKVHSWDTALEAGQRNDYSVNTCWGVNSQGVYLYDVLKKRMEYPELKRTVRTMYQLDRPNYVLIERKASGHSLIQELKREAIPIIPIEPEESKLIRAKATTGLVEAGRVFVPADAPWLADFLTEHQRFDKGAHDDQVDSQSQALSFIRERNLFAAGGAVIEVM